MDFNSLSMMQTYTDELYFGNIDTVIEKIKETEEELKNILIVGT